MSPDPRKPVDPRPVRKPRRRRRTKLQRVIQDMGGQALDRRTTIGKALAQWRGELAQDLGGAAGATASDLALVDLTARTMLLLYTVDAWLLKQPSLVHDRKGALLPIVLQRQQLADSLARNLGLLARRRDAALRSADSRPARRGGRAAETAPPSAPPPLPPGFPEEMTGNTPEATASRDRVRDLIDLLLARRVLGAKKSEAKESNPPSVILSDI